MNQEDAQALQVAAEMRMLSTPNQSLIADMAQTTPPTSLSQNWDRPDPFVISIEVSPKHIDALGHSNNVHYLDWLQQCAWQHSAAVGQGTEAMLATGYAMAVRDVRMSYLSATFAGDHLWVGDWMIRNDGKLRATRAFQILREADAACVMRAEIDYICIHVATGRPKRMPELFRTAYAAV